MQEDFHETVVSAVIKLVREEAKFFLQHPEEVSEQHLDFLRKLANLITMSFEGEVDETKPDFNS